MTEDQTLLTRFSTAGDQRAFHDWVDHRLPLVYSTAMRILGGDRQLAEDVSQQVFNDAAQHAAELAEHPALSGWLFSSTRFAATKLIRAQSRRSQRERTAAMDPALAPNPIDWEAMRPVIDDALASLSDTDRNAVIQRYFDQADYQTIGQRLDLAPNTARMRVERALEKLSTQLERRGIRSTAAALGSVLAANSITAAPVGLASSIATTATASVVVGSTASILSLFAMTKAPLLVSVAVIIIGSTSVAIQYQIDPSPPIHAITSEPITASPPPISTPTRIDEPPVRAPDLTHTLATEAAALRVKLNQLDTEIAARLAHSQPHGPVYPVAQLDKQPQVKKRGRPVYPAAFREAGIPGHALIAFTVDQSGRVTDLETVEASHAEFAEASLETIATWEFSPGVIGSNPVNTRMRVPMNYTINKKAKSDVDFWF